MENTNGEINKETSERSFVSSKERQNIIKNYILKYGHISVEYIVKRFQISKMTAWRDLKNLDELNEIMKVRGGAIVKRQLSEEVPISEKEITAEKVAIATYAAEKLISDNETILVDSGSTPLQMIPRIKKKNVTLISNGLNTLLRAIRENPSLYVIGTGGNIREKSESFIGPEAEQFLKSFGIYADKVFLSGMAITPEKGLTERFYEEISVKKSMVHKAKIKIVLLESKKIGKKERYVTLESNNIDILVTDDKAPNEFIEEMQNRGVDVKIVHI